MNFKNYFSPWVLLAGVLAITSVGHANVESDKTPSATTTMIKMYESEEGKKIIADVSPAIHLIEIYRKGEWIKVGNPKDGSVGWVNQKQYLEAIDAFNKPDIQTIFISKTLNSDKKPQINIVAYKNGEPVSKEEADKLYKKFKVQEAAQKKQWDVFNNQMIKQWHGHIYQDPFFNFPLFFN